MFFKGWRSQVSSIRRIRHAAVNGVYVSTSRCSLVELGLDGMNGLLTAEQTQEPAAHKIFKSNTMWIYIVRKTFKLVITGSQEEGEREYNNRNEGKGNIVIESCSISREKQEQLTEAPQAETSAVFSSPHSCVGSPVPQKCS